MLKADSAHYWSSDSTMHHQLALWAGATSTQSCRLSENTHTYVIRGETNASQKYIYVSRSGLRFFLNQYVNQKHRFCGLKSHKTPSVSGKSLSTGNRQHQNKKQRVAKENTRRDSGKKKNRVIQSFAIAFSH